MKLFPEDSIIKSNSNVKFGIDPTFNRLHLGHFVALRLCKKLLLEGHNLDIIIGNFTARLGDPSGRDSTRPILSVEDVENNSNSILSQLESILGFEYSNLSYIKNSVIHSDTSLNDFLTYISKFSLSYVLSRNGFQDRLDSNSPIALHELMVPILQGLDSVYLETDVEIGGSDQLFNFQIARKLQEDSGQKPQSCIMVDIINGTDGRKMSKSLNNCIWLDDTPEDIFGKVMSISDITMLEWVPILTDITDINIHPMELKKLLAHNIISQILSNETANLAQKHFETTVQNKELPDDIPFVSAKSIIEALSLYHGLSKTSIRQLFKSGAITLNSDTIFNDCDVKSGDIIGKGKRAFIKVCNDG